MRPQTHLIVAAYDEADRIGATLAALAVAFPGAVLWVADDGSSDATGEIARAAGARVVRSERVVGKGEAVTEAAREALVELQRSSRGEEEGEKEHGEDGEAEGGEAEGVFVLCDGDLAESARALGALVEPIRREEADMVVAAFARRVGGGLGLAVGFARWAIRRRCGLEMTAPISGQRALRARTLQDVLPFAHGFGMEVGMTIDAVRTGHRVAEVEIDLAHRASGSTLAGFAHRGRQLADFIRVYVQRR